jgi:hypothetical protein
MRWEVCVSRWGGRLQTSRVWVFGEGLERGVVLGRQVKGSFQGLVWNKLTSIGTPAYFILFQQLCKFKFYLKIYLTVKNHYESNTAKFHNFF